MTEPTEPTYIVVEQAPAPAKRRFPRWAIAAFAAMLLAGAGAGTFASFSASTTNSATFASGTLVLTNSVNSGTVCYSSGTTATNNVNTDTNDNQNCAALFSLTTKKPGDSATANLDLRNDGTVDGSALQAFVTAGCTSTNTAEIYHGTGDLCSALQVTIQEYSSSANRTSGTVAGGNCRFGGNEGAGLACSYSATRTLNNLAAYTTGSPLGLGAFNQQTTRYFQIGISLPSTATNNVQGRQVTTGLSWRVIQ